MIKWIGCSFCSSLRFNLPLVLEIQFTTSPSSGSSRKWKKKKKKKRREILDSSRMVSNRYRNVVESIVYFPLSFAFPFEFERIHLYRFKWNNWYFGLVCAKENYYKKNVFWFYSTNVYYFLIVKGWLISCWIKKKPNLRWIWKTGYWIYKILLYA